MPAATTQILPFSTAGTNDLSPAAYAALTALLANGFSSGIALSNQINTVLRQTSFMSAGLANWMVSQGISVPDDRNMTNLVAEIQSAMQAFLTSNISLIGGLNPPGTIIQFAGNYAPTGYLVCPTAPTSISRTTYAALFAAIGTQWGSGDGSTTFNMPWFNSDSTVIHGTPGTAAFGNVISHNHGDAGHFHGYNMAVSTGNQKPASGGTAPYDSQSSQPTGTGNANIQNSGVGMNYPAGSRVLMCVKY